VPDVGEEALALLAVVADVDACFDLCRDGRRRRISIAARSRRVDGFAVAAAAMKLGQRAGAASCRRAS
jgi:hypothetical protein